MSDGKACFSWATGSKWQTLFLTSSCPLLRGYACYPNNLTRVLLRDVAIAL